MLTGARTTPDYAGLVRLLFQLRVFPDWLGWTFLSEKEAAAIRSLGFEAVPGYSKVPMPLPPELVVGTPLEGLSIGWEKFQADLLRASQVQKPAGQPSGGDREVVDPSARFRLREIEVKPIDLCPGQHEVKQPVPPYGEDRDAKLVKELVSKMRERAEKADRPMQRRRLQQLYWRYPGKIFNRAFAIMVRDRRIFLEVR
jgi:hypothetical protein